MIGIHKKKLSIFIHSWWGGGKKKEQVSAETENISLYWVSYLHLYDINSMLVHHQYVAGYLLLL